MIELPENVADLDERRTLKGSHSNGGGDFDGRLRTLEVQVARIDERVASMQENMAKKNDVTGLKVWILGGVLSGMAVAASISAIVVKAFS